MWSVNTEPKGSVLLRISSNQAPLISYIKTDLRNKKGFIVLKNMSIHQQLLTGSLLNTGHLPIGNWKLSALQECQ